MFQTINVPSFHATERPCNKSKNRGARNKVQEPKNKIFGAKSLEQNPWNKNFGAKNPQILRFLGGKIDQKSDFWNIVLHCSERETSCTFVGTRLCRPNKSDLPTADAAERSKTAVCRGQNSVRRPHQPSFLGKTIHKIWLLPTSQQEYPNKINPIIQEK